MFTRKNCDFVPYQQARARLCDGDVLLCSLRIRWYNPLDWLLPLIAIGTRSWCVHAAMVVQLRGCIYCVQETTTEDHHLRLSEVVKRWPGRVHVYRPRWDKTHMVPHWSGVMAADHMLRLSGKRYGWLNLFRVACRLLPIVWRILPKDTDDAEKSMFPPFCSAAVSEAIRTTTGLDLVSDKPDRLTTPRDLAESKHLKYLFTLDWK